MIGYLLALCLLGLGVVCRSPEVRAFLRFVHHHNPLLIQYYEDYDQDEEEGEGEAGGKANAPIANTSTNTSTPEEAYEARYLAKFRAMPNEFGAVVSVSDTERAEVAAAVLRVHRARRQERLADLDEKVRRAEEALALAMASDPSADAPRLADTDAARQALLRYWGLEDEYDYDPDSFDLAEYFGKLVSERDEWRAKRQTTLAQSDPDVEKEVDQVLLERRLAQLKHNYVTEATPLGNVIMRYNHAKESFEYFSDRTMPFRMLETVCRKYVITYFCKPLFVEMETHVTAKTAKPKTDKVANRYSWEGRLREFSPLQSVPRVQKNAMNYAEFKKRFAATKPTPAAR